MQIRTLVDNTCADSRLGSEHGLSLYIQSARHSILFDTGQGGLFLENARLMDIAVDHVDILVISHGHYDHGGGLGAFLRHNRHAKVYIHKHAFARFWSKKPDGGLKDIGLDPDLANNRRISPVADYFKIDDELELFAGVKGRDMFSPANSSLLCGPAGAMKPDDFRHEQNMIIANTLLAGCAHNGVVNILERYKQIKGNYPAVFVGGFHLMGSPALQAELDGLAERLGNKLRQYPTIFYTGHCTGQRAFAILKDIMGGQINYLAGGDGIEF